ncbi:hypothetical protein K2173_008672 [Erythroxylum novogranatense]|uniref:ferric-chelate reductase (NADH) n=1 Tax=Erythroxylum novogranatense TaxID=1862640 RepID=A0AAV8SL31_9ROSI|nr:hypothetical protein K2173_008672 [Erythroxylum novogranatense]
MVSGAESGDTNGATLFRSIRSGIKLLVTVIFLGYLIIWLMMPMHIYYQHWFPKISAKTRSTFLGGEGSWLLIYTFPVLLIATLACIYLHLGKKIPDDSFSKNGATGSGFGWWKRTAVVKGPLGIVSWIELTFLGMFVGLLVWTLASYLHGMFETSVQEAELKGLQVWEYKLDCVGLTLGLVGYVSMALLFFPVTRLSSILQFLGVTSESSIKYHIWMGHICMILFTAHGLCYIFFWAKTHQISEMLKWDKFSISNVAGEISLLAGLVMWPTSLKQFRRKLFELFFYTHYFYILFVVFFVFHVGFYGSCIILPGFYLFLIDRFLRLLQSQQKVALVFARVLSCESVELNISKLPGLCYTPMSSIFINVPSISRLQWHPFTITSNSNTDPDKLSIIIKSEGSWSSELYKILSSPSPIDRLELSVEGPYGPPSTHFMRHDMLVMVCGGSGITPFISIIREVIFAANTKPDRTIPRILLICAFRKYVDLTVLELILPISSTKLDVSHLQIQIEAYITREKEINTSQQLASRTIWFKPASSDAPVHSILGHNSWLWLGAIISASFIIFLLIIGILIRCYIYPIDHNTDTIYPAVPKSVLNMVAICSSIVMTASVAFIWNKKQMASEIKQIKDMGSQPFNTQKDLENMGDYQSLLQVTNVQFSGRPNLKDRLMKCEGKSVGVLVSGPKGMRQDVAKICSSDVSGNLHFESISFSW